MKNNQQDENQICEITEAVQDVLVDFEVTVDMCDGEECISSTEFEALEAAQKRFDQELERFLKVIVPAVRKVNES